MEQKSHMKGTRSPKWTKSASPRPMDEKPTNVLSLLWRDVWRLLRKSLKLASKWRLYCLEHYACRWPELEWSTLIILSSFLMFWWLLVNMKEKKSKWCRDAWQKRMEEENVLHRLRRILWDKGRQMITLKKCEGQAFWGTVLCKLMMLIISLVSLNDFWFFHCAINLIIFGWRIFLWNNL